MKHQIRRNLSTHITSFSNKLRRTNTTCNNNGNDSDLASKNNFSTCTRQTLVALGPLILTIGLGMTSGYSAILIPQLQSKNSKIIVDHNQISWIASMAALPMAIGCIFGTLSMEKFGRKSTHMLSCIPTLSGWFLIYFAFNIEMILIGRFLTGIVIGILGPVTGVYIGETSEPKYRGILLAAISFAIALGLFISHVLGTFLYWETTALISCTIPIISFIILLFVPESPVWLAKKSKTKNAEESFYWCRGSSEDAKKELTIMMEKQNLLLKEVEKTFVQKLKELLVPEFLKPLSILVVFIVCNQWSGVNAITFYTVTIMQEINGNDLNKYLAMLIVDSIRVVASIVACVLLRKLTRRSLAIISGTGTFISLFTLSAFTYLSKTYPNVPDSSIIPMAALILYISFVSIGFVPLPWAMIGEVFPQNTRSFGSGITSFMAFISWFSVVKINPSMFDNLGAEGGFFVYGMVAFFGTIFVSVFLPETKNKPLHEIEEHFKRKNENNNIQNSEII